VIPRLAALALFALLPLAASAQTPTPPPLGAPSPTPLQPGDAFGQEVTLPDRTIIYFRGRGKWDSALETLLDAFGSLNQYVDKQGIKPSGPPLTVYTDTNDSGFQFLAALPIAATPADPPKGDIAVGKAPTGRALKFTHRGSYDSMDTTYEAITNYLDEKRLDAKDMFIEQYISGPLKSGDDKLVANVYVPVK
jgi:effector-binding domain-containing protein